MKILRSRSASAPRRAWCGGLLAVIALSLHPLPSSAASTYPDHVIRLVVPFAAGSATDVVARQVVGRMSELLGQGIVVDNRGGASGIIGANIVAKASPDGYTLLFGTAPTNAIEPSWEKNSPYDASKDFTAVAAVSTAPYVLAVNASLPIHSVKELIAYAKAHPGQLNYASTGSGTGTQLAGAFFAAKAGIDLRQIPYNAAGQMSSDLGSGRVQLIFYPHQGLLPLIQSGKLREIATTAATRSPLLPGLPTLQEEGLPDFELMSFQGLYAPAGTPPDRVKVLYEAVRRTLTDPKVIASVAQTGNSVEVQDPEQFAAYTRREIERYRQIIQTSGLKRPD